MLVFFSGRHLKPGHWEQFREAWAPSDEDTAGFPDGTVIYHARSIKDEDEVISFGIFDVDRESKDTIRGDAESEAKRRVEMDKHVKDIPLEGIYEVVEEIRP
jgi:heme-degrading monooxygenase HmoA